MIFFSFVSCFFYSSNFFPLLDLDRNKKAYHDIENRKKLKDFQQRCCLRQNKINTWLTEPDKRKSTDSHPSIYNSEDNFPSDYELVWSQSFYNIIKNKEFLKLN